MKDVEFADELINRLNNLIKNSNIKKDIGRLLGTQIKVSLDTCEHATIQAGQNILSVLGFINGIAGVIESGEKQGWGYITAVYDENNNLMHFVKTCT